MRSPPWRSCEIQQRHREYHRSECQALTGGFAPRKRNGGMVFGEGTPAR